MSIPQTHSFALGSVTFWDTGYEVYVNENGTNVPPFASPRLNVTALAGASGAVANGTYFEPQEITLRCSVAAGDGDSESRLTNIWAALKAHHEANAEELLVVQPWSSRQYYVRWSGASDAEEHAGGVDFDLYFIATNPRVS